MNNNLRLEKVLPEDAEKIRDILVRIVEDEAERWFNNGEKPFLPGYNSIEMQRYHTWDDKFYKIIYLEEIVGIILISYSGKEHGRIDRLYILPQYQSLGIGGKVLELIENLYSEVKVWTLDTTQKSFRNHHFYEKNRYKLVGEDNDERYYCKVTDGFKYNEEDYFYRKDFSNNNFRQCNIEKADLYDSSMNNSKFSDMNMSNNLYTNTNLANSRFTNTNMSNSIFGDSNMRNMEICHSSLSNTHIHHINLDVPKEECSITIEGCEFSNSKIKDSNLENMIIESCNIKGMTINGVKVEEMIRVYYEYRKDYS